MKILSRDCEVHGSSATPGFGPRPFHRRERNILFLLFLIDKTLVVVVSVEVWKKKDGMSNPLLWHSVFFLPMTVDEGVEIPGVFSIESLYPQ